MKFGENIVNLSIPQWKGYNLDYNDLKSKIKQLTKNHNCSDGDSDSPYATTYNDSKQVTLDSLMTTFVENFQFVDLFINTKGGEVERKLEHCQKIFAKLQSQQSLTLDKQLKINDLQYQALELSKLIRDLNRFTIVQKLACNKIFKKFLKYYPDTKVSNKFVNNLKNYLHSNHDSFINADFTSITLELTYFIDMINEEAKRLKSEEDGRRKSKNSLFSNKSLSSASPTSTVGATTGGASITSHCSKHILPDLYKGANFDLEIVFKKNFKIHCLVADNHKLSELLLNLKVLLGCEEWNDNKMARNNSCLSLASSFQSNFTCATSGTNSSSVNQYLVSFTYLTQKFETQPSQAEPSFVLSQFGSTHSLIVSQVGGLRRSAYCSLPNSVIQKLFDFLLDRENPEKTRAFQQWFTENQISPLTKLSIDWILKKNLVPTLKLVCKRSRYVIHKENQSQNGDDDYNDDDDEEEEENFHETRNHQNGFNKSNDTSKDDFPDLSHRKYEDDFLLCLDQDILTTNNPMLVNSIKFDPRLDGFDKDNTCITNLFNDESWDRFPFHHISIHSNDSNLFNFKRDMNKNPLNGSVCTDTIIDNPNQRSLKRLPLKIIQLFQLNSVKVFNGDLHFYHYMLSCYFNMIPPQNFINNHYINLLTLNLLKQNEDLSTLNQVNKIHDRLFEKKTRQVLKSQSSLKSIKSMTSQKLLNNDPFTEDYYTNQSKSTNLNNQTNNSSIPINKALYKYKKYHNGTYDQAVPINKQEIEFLKNNINNYGSITNPMQTYGQSSWSDDLGLFDRFVYHATKIKQRLFRNQKKYDLENGIGQYYYNGEDHRTAMIDNIDFDRTSISSLESANNNSRMILLKDKYEDQYMANYDEILAIVYFSFFFISLFISGIIMGIVYSLISLSTEDSQFLLEDNLFLVFIIVFGLFLSLIFSMISINLNISRYTQAPKWHSVVVWTGVGGVALSFTWCLALLYN